jgi:MFS family permease
VYRLDWIEQLKLRLTTVPTAGRLINVSPVVWTLGFTSLLTDISTEMVNSALPVYLVLHLHLSPVQYGVVDGVYNGLAVVLLSIAAGLVADKWGRHKEIAGFGYALSAFCKVLLLAAGGAWGWIAAVAALDRIGKGVRSAPRDALISFNTPIGALASAFAVHRALDAGGALLGPVVAFILLAQIPGAFDVLWLTSFVFAIIGIVVLSLFVPGSKTPEASLARMRGTAADSVAADSEDGRSVVGRTLALLAGKKFGAVTACALLLAAGTVSDGFIYLVLQQRTNTPGTYLPLFYVGTACFYMLFSLPVGALADKIGRTRVLMGGYGTLVLIYVAIVATPKAGLPVTIACLALMGLYYAATEGILMALASAILPAGLRTSGLALIGTAIGLGKMLSSVVFGWAWSTYGQWQAVVAFAILLAIAVVVAVVWLRAVLEEPVSAH